MLTADIVASKIVIRIWLGNSGTVGDGDADAEFAGVGLGVVVGCPKMLVSVML